MRSHLVVFLAFITTAAARCSCNSAVGPEQDPGTLSNAAQQILSLAITFLNRTPATPHLLALTTGAMFEALLIARGKETITDVNVRLGRLSEDQAVGYAGYAALSRVLTSFLSDPDQSAALDAAAADIGLGDTSIRDEFGIPIAAAIAAKYPLTLPPVPYTPPNPASSSRDAQCGAIVDPDGWQPLCVTPPSGGPCVEQTVPFLPLVNASLITDGGRRSVAELIADVPPPNTFTRCLRRYPNVDNDFTRDYNRVLSASARLNDQRKIIAEVFAPNAALGVHRLALDEVATRNLDVAHSARVFFAVSAAVRDGLIGSSTVKVTYSTVRPVTVFQCGFRGRGVRTWRGPYQGVGKLTSTRRTQFRSYIQTPPFPGYISGHTTVAGAAGRVLTRFFGRDVSGANCFVVPRGGSVIEGRRVRGEQGFVEGVTDVPNSGRRGVGFTPAEETTVCWSSFNEYARRVARSRLLGGVHTPLENVVGLRVGRKAGNRAFRFVAQFDV